jgi:hypothetical protein
VVSPWLRAWSIFLSLFVASVGTVLVFGLVLHGSFLDGLTDWATDVLRPRPGLQAFLAGTPLIAALLLGWAAGRKRSRRKKAEELAALRRDAGLG